MIAYEVHRDDIEDLCDSPTRDRLSVGLADLACSREDLANRSHTSPSWDLAERLITAGVAGVKVPSFAPGSRPGTCNVAFWTWPDDPPHEGPVIDDLRRLSRDPSSVT